MGQEGEQVCFSTGKLSMGVHDRDDSKTLTVRFITLTFKLRSVLR